MGYRTRLGMGNIAGVRENSLSGADRRFFDSWGTVESDNWCRTTIDGDETDRGVTDDVIRRRSSPGSSNTNTKTPIHAPKGGIRSPVLDRIPHETRGYRDGGYPLPKTRRHLSVSESELARPVAIDIHGQLSRCCTSNRGDSRRHGGDTPVVQRGEIRSYDTYTSCTPHLHETRGLPRRRCAPRSPRGDRTAAQHGGMGWLPDSMPTVGSGGMAIHGRSRTSDRSNHGWHPLDAHGCRQVPRRSRSRLLSTDQGPAAILPCP